MPVKGTNKITPGIPQTVPPISRTSTVAAALNLTSPPITYGSTIYSVLFRPSEFNKNKR